MSELPVFWYCACCGEQVYAITVKCPRCGLLIYGANYRTGHGDGAMQK